MSEKRVVSITSVETVRFLKTKKTFEMIGVSDAGEPVQIKFPLDGLHKTLLAGEVALEKHFLAEDEFPDSETMHVPKEIEIRWDGGKGLVLNFCLPSDTRICFVFRSSASEAELKAAATQIREAIRRVMPGMS